MEPEKQISEKSTVKFQQLPQNHSAAVTSIDVRTLDTHDLVLTASEDGSIKLWHVQFNSEKPAKLLKVIVQINKGVPTREK